MMIETFLTAFVVLLGAFVVFGIPAILAGMAGHYLVERDHPLLAIAFLVVYICGASALMVTLIQHRTVAAITDIPASDDHP
jgi:hypothetical protein